MGVMPTLAQSTWPSSTPETAPQTQKPVPSPRPATALRLTSCTTRTSLFPDSKASTLMTRRRPTSGSPLRRSRTSSPLCDRPSASSSETEPSQKAPSRNSTPASAPSSTPSTSPPSSTSKPPSSMSALLLTRPSTDNTLSEHGDSSVSTGTTGMPSPSRPSAKLKPFICKHHLLMPVINQISN